MLLNVLKLADIPQSRRRQLGLEQENLCTTQMRAAAELCCSEGELLFPGVFSAIQTVCPQPQVNHCIILDELI